MEDSNDGPTLMLIRYQKAYYQPTKNSLNRTCPIHNNYMGTVIGVSEQVFTWHFTYAVPNSSLIVNQQTKVYTVQNNNVKVGREREVREYKHRIIRS